MFVLAPALTPSKLLVSVEGDGSCYLDAATFGPTFTQVLRPLPPDASYEFNKLMIWAESSEPINLKIGTGPGYLDTILEATASVRDGKATFDLSRETFEGNKFYRIEVSSPDPYFRIRGGAPPACEGEYHEWLVGGINGWSNYHPMPMRIWGWGK